MGEAFANAGVGVNLGVGIWGAGFGFGAYMGLGSAIRGPPTMQGHRVLLVLGLQGSWGWG